MMQIRYGFQKVQRKLSRFLTISAHGRDGDEWAETQAPLSEEPTIFEVSRQNQQLFCLHPNISQNPVYVNTALQPLLLKSKQRAVLKTI